GDDDLFDPVIVFMLGMGGQRAQACACQKKQGAVFHVSIPKGESSWSAVMAPGEASIERCTEHQPKRGDRPRRKELCQCRLRGGEVPGSGGAAPRGWRMPVPARLRWPGEWMAGEGAARPRRCCPDPCYGAGYRRGSRAAAARRPRGSG